MNSKQPVSDIDCPVGLGKWWVSQKTSEKTHLRATCYWPVAVGADYRRCAMPSLADQLFDYHICDSCTLAPVSAPDVERWEELRRPPETLQPS